MKICISLILFFFCSSMVYADQVGVALKDMPLFEQPNQKSEAVFSITKNDKISILEQKDGWYKAQITKKQVGWLLMSDIRFQAAKKTSSSWIADLLTTAMDVSPSSNAFSGERGMTEYEFEKFNAEQKAHL